MSVYSRPNFAEARSDHDQLTWIQGFMAYIRDGHEGPERDLGFTSDEIARLAGLADTFDEMYLAASNRAGRTHDDVARKDAARDAAMAAFRKHANRIKTDPRIKPEIKICLGIKPPEATVRKRVEAPATVPVIDIRGGIPGQGHMIVVTDSATPHTRKRPHGVAHMQFFMGLTPVDGPLPAGPDDPVMRFVRNEKAWKFTMPFTAAQLGQMATYYGRWETRTGLLGPWSMPVSMAVVV